MIRSMLAGSVAACICLGLAAPLLAAEPPAPATANPAAPVENTAAANQPAQQCLTDLRAFDGQMQKDGYWLSGSGYGYGYPMMGGYGFGYGYPMNGGVTPTQTGYRDARPGYDVRTLIAAANILARGGHQQACEDVLATTRDTYNVYVADLKSGKAPTANVPGWQQEQIAAAQPVTAKNTSFRSDQLLGTAVLNPQNVALGSVDDIVMSPQTGKIAYLVVARGGIFGIDEKYVAVPWGDFRITPTASLLVLDTTKSAMDSGPLVSHDQFATPGLFDQESQKVDAYWKAHLSNNSAGKTNG
jgi:sporulation protein YlmC with PRC-barrel domain